MYASTCRVGRHIERDDDSMLIKQEFIHACVCWGRGARACVRACVCVCDTHTERERERERERDRQTDRDRERGREGYPSKSQEDIYLKLSRLRPFQQTSAAGHG